MVIGNFFVYSKLIFLVFDGSCLFLLVVQQSLVIFCIFFITDNFKN